MSKRTLTARQLEAMPLEEFRALRSDIVSGAILLVNEPAKTAQQHQDPYGPFDSSGRERLTADDLREAGPQEWDKMKADLAAGRVVLG